MKETAQYLEKRFFINYVVRLQLTDLVVYSKNKRGDIQ
jgi:hypothetical protein